MSRYIYATARVLAWFGSIVLTGLAVLSVVSIGGRALSGFGLGPVPGDFELVEAGTALAVFCFLPWCHLQRAHAVVDMLWGAYPAPLRRVFDVLADALMLAVWWLLTWRMGVMTLEYRAHGEVSFILQMPVWWGYAASLAPAAVGCLIYAWRLAETLRWVPSPTTAPASERMVEH